MTNASLCGGSAGCMVVSFIIDQTSLDAHIDLGNALVSTGDSGRVHLWKQQLNGDYVEFAETMPS